MLLNPLRDKSEIEKRLDMIEKLNNEFLLREELRNNLYKIYDSTSKERTLIFFSFVKQLR